MEHRPGQSVVGPESDLGRDVTLSRYLEPTHEALVAILARARALDNVLQDVHSLAYDKPSTQPGEGRSGEDGMTFDTLSLDARGKQRARRALAELERFSLKFSKEIEVQYAAIYSLFSGPGANDKLRGTTLGNDKGHGASVELKQLINKQRDRKDRGEYTPSPSEEQPEIQKR